MTPHYLRLARTLALVGSTVLPGCASSVVPNYDDVATITLPDGRIVLADAGSDVPVVPGDAACPSFEPANGSACNAPQRCDLGCSECTCTSARPGEPGTWRCLPRCGGPLDPPDLAAA